MIISYILLSLQVLSFGKCAKILSVFPSPGYSQFILAEKLMTELAKKGHEVTVVSPYKPKEDVKNYRSILVDGILELHAGDDLFKEDTQGVFQSLIHFEEFTRHLADYILSHKEVQKLIHSNETFDLVIIEQFGNEAHMGFASLFNAPVISFSSIGLSDWNAHLVGNVRLSSVNPFNLSPYTDRMTIFQRVHNVLLNWFDYVFKKFVAFPNQQELLDKYFPKKIKLEDVMYNVSLLLLNSHASTTYPSTLTSSVIEIGGFHISPKKLPSDIQKFLDEASDGAIFFSMGSNLKSANLPKYKKNGILKTFSKLKERVLWKFEDTNIPNKPDNVFISKWMPQSDILAHPNIRAFITHGGLLSTTEAIHYGVPMIGIPIFGDQKMNVATSVQKGIAVHLPFTELKEESLHEALNKILRNPKYSKNSKEYSKTFKDQIVKPIDLAMFWIDYVIRHGGAPRLRNASVELYWFQLYLLDVYCFIIFCLLLAYYSIKFLTRSIFATNTKNSVKRSKEKIN